MAAKQSNILRGHITGSGLSTENTLPLQKKINTKTDKTLEVRDKNE